MILYHGSYIAVEKPSLSFSRLRTDFGMGFYTTPIRVQAGNWSRRFLRNHGTAVVSIYDFSPDKSDYSEAGVRALVFPEYNIGWLEFVTACRIGHPVDRDYDLVVGGVANDKVFDTLQLYFDGLIRADEAIGRLRYDKPNLQYCFKNQALIDEHLHFTAAYPVAGA
ncbi:MAG: DUF3990 domain-containing protein [Oscillospiraceae bacterium]|nr:DUF3990 domain-containing protein [Oscillospiraceae bacterium]